MFGKEVSEETRRLQSRPGDKNPRWVGGISFLPYPTTWTRELRERIRTRDGNRCQLCGVHQDDRPRRLTVHHIDYDKDNVTDTNLITLCGGCNARVNSNRDQWQAHFATLLEA